MELNQINESSYLDLLFEGRNRAYGAYDIRTHYPRHLRKAMTIAIILFVGMALLPSLARSFAAAILPTPPPIKITEVSMPTPPPEKAKTPEKILPPPEAKPIEQVAVKTMAFLPPKVVKDADAPTTPPTMDDLAGKAIGQTTTDGKTSGNNAPTTPTGKGAALPTAPPIIPEPREVIDAPHTFVEQKPEFPGGEKALFQYLADNTHYPQMAREVGTDGRVFLQFVVEKDGSITDVKVLRGIGSGCDEEAMRVIKTMPHWAAGKQNGRPVRVLYNLPFVFHLE
jgi:periplasmic protein TonB